MDYNCLQLLDSRLRGNDKGGCFRLFTKPSFFDIGELVGELVGLWRILDLIGERESMSL
ncbi:MAG: hypothetical protein KAU60_05810 [Desulfobacterales bacterium]|nr:hypothetical protein [Desulfobacterales bacterium]